MGTTLSIEQFEQIYCSNIPKNQGLLKMKSYLEKRLLHASLQSISELMNIAQKLEEVNCELDKLTKKELNQGIKKTKQPKLFRNKN